MSSKIGGAALVVASLVAVLSLMLPTGQSSGERQTSDSDEGGWLVDKDVIASQLGEAVRLNEYPDEFELSLNGEVVPTHVQYSFDQSSQQWMEKLMSRYRPDYGAFVAMDAETGQLLTLVSYSRVRSDLENLTLRATFPAASIFKVVTASAALDLDKAKPETIVPFNGANHTLYKRNIEDTRVNRWTKRMTLREAFAKSANVFFGKLGLFYVGPENLLQYAERFLFNHPIKADVPVQIGYARFDSEDPWSVVSAASGFTRDNTMSPMHGALIAAAVANDGIMMEPYLIEQLRTRTGDVLYQASPQTASVVVEPHVAAELRVLFRQTVISGTSRKSFRQTVQRSLFDDVEFGGKTGSLTGMDPYGKCDWFVGYGMYKNHRVAVAALTVNEKKWRVKSSMLANLFFTRYFKDLKEEMRRQERFAQHKEPLASSRN